jgi:hypothetical protein
MGVRVEGRGESCRKFEERAECPLRMVAPQSRDLDAWSTRGIEVGPFQVGRRHDDGLACPGFRGLLRLSSSGFLGQYRGRQNQRRRNPQDAS